jgi:tetratricopeptide (TPR) repeat protein
MAFILTSQNNLEQCESEARKTIELDPQQAAAFIILGFLEEKKKHFPEAMIAVQRAIQINPNIPTGYASLGRLQVKLKNWEESKDALQEAIRLEPRIWQTYYQLAIAYGRSRPKYQAIGYLWKAIRLHPPLIFDLMQTLETPLGMGLIIFSMIIILLHPIFFPANAILPFLILVVGEGLLAIIFNVIKSGFKSSYMKNIIVLRAMLLFLLIALWCIIDFLSKH